MQGVSKEQLEQAKKKKITDDMKINRKYLLNVRNLS